VELGLSSEEPGGTDNQGFSQEWFDENCSFSASRQETEELQLQELQIEQEASDKTLKRMVAKISTRKFVSSHYCYSSFDKFMR
jgi:hypothetical protein